MADIVCVTSDWRCEVHVQLRVDTPVGNKPFFLAHSNNVLGPREAVGHVEEVYHLLRILLRTERLRVNGLMLLLPFTSNRSERPTDRMSAGHVKHSEAHCR